MKRTSFKFKNYYDFDTKAHIQTHFGTVIHCYDDLPPIPEEVVNSTVIKRSDTYLGRNTRELKSLGINVKDLSAINNRNTIPNDAIIVFDGYEFYEFDDVIKEVLIGNKILVGTLRVDIRHVPYGEIHRRVVLHDPDYDIYFSIPTRVQWISRVTLDKERIETIKNAFNKVFNNRSIIWF